MKNEKSIDTYIYKLGEKQFILKETDSSKVCHGEEYNFVFDKKTGDFARWGTEIEDDPLFSPIGPEILDFEISVNGCSVGCPFCLPEGALIDTPNGTKKIEEIKKGDVVLGFDFDNREVREENVVETSSRHYKGNLVIIELEDGRIVELTADHMVMTKDGKEIAAEDLSSEDDVVFL